MDTGRYTQSTWSTESLDITDMGKFVHQITDSDDSDKAEAKRCFNEQLISNSEIEIIHQKKLETQSAIGLESLWDLSQPDMEKFNWDYSIKEI